MPSGKKVSDATIHLILSIHRMDPDLSTREIAKRVGVSHNTVARLIKKADTDDTNPSFQEWLNDFSS